MNTVTQNLSILAGPKALVMVRDKGLNPNDITVIAGAAGGPKWLVLGHLDRIIFSNFFKNRLAPLFLIGSSIGSWRFAAVSQNNAIPAIERFQDAYVNQTYAPNVTPKDVTKECNRIIDIILGDTGAREILNHPFLRMSAMTARCRQPVAYEQKQILLLGLAGSALFNTIHRNFLKLFFTRSLFYHPGNIPPFMDMNQFPIQKTPLGESNIKDVLLASASIPLVMTGIKNIPGANPGMYRDGGIIDYHLDIPFLKNKDKIVLYPHYTDRIIPGWLDKKLPWRKPDPSNIDNVVLISPSRQFIKTLPLQKIPDRNDFLTFKNNDRARITYWNQVIEKSKYLAEEFWDAVDSNRIKNIVKPMEEKN